MGMSSQFHGWPLYPWGKGFFLPTVEVAGSVSGPVWEEKEISPPPGFNHRTVQPVAGSNTDCTTLVPLNVWRQNINVMCNVSCTVVMQTEHYYFYCGKMSFMPILFVLSLCLLILPPVLTDMCVQSGILNIYLLLKFIIRSKTAAQYC